MKRTLLLSGLLTILAAAPSALLAQQAGYSQTNLVSNTAGIATTTDPQLLNPWGISFIEGEDFWVANNNSGTSTLYDSQGTKDANLVVTIPGATHNPNGNCNPGCPTGTVVNPNASYFGGGQFIFDTEDGLIADWTGTSNTAAVVVDNSASGAVYKGLGTLGNFLLAANFNSGRVDVFDRNFQPAALGGTFTNQNLARGFAPHGIRVIGHQVYVAYAMQDGAKHDAQPGAGLGQVDIFDANGNFVKTLVGPGGALNAPWGVAVAPTSFGTFANAVLIGNFGDGKINAFDSNGTLLGQVSDTAGHALVNPGLWEIAFGGGGVSGDPGTLYLTAGGGNQPNFPAGGSTTAVFASLSPASGGGNPDFSLNPAAQSLAVARGGSASLMIQSGAMGGFNGAITLSCGAAAGLTCTFNPATISPGSSSPSSTLTVSAASIPPGGGYGAAGVWVLLPGLGLFGTFVMSGKRKPLTRKAVLQAGALSLMVAISLFAVGCGSSGNKGSGSSVNLIVTGTSGAISHSFPVTINVQ